MVRERDRRINDLLAELRQSRLPADDDEAIAREDDRGRTGPLPAASDVELREALLSLKARALELQGVLLESERDGE